MFAGQPTLMRCIRPRYLGIFCMCELAHGHGTRLELWRQAHDHLASLRPTRLHLGLEAEWLGESWLARVTGWTMQVDLALGRNLQYLLHT